MQNNPLVSIITPCYNSERWINRYLDSIVSQTYDNIELIIINDGSCDGTESIVLSRKDELERKGVRLIYRKQQNKGLGGAINAGLKEISGEFFTWCDSDNFYTMDYVKTKAEFFKSHPEFDIVRCDGYIVNQSDISKPIRKMAAFNTDKYNQKLFLNALMAKNFHFGCAMLRTEAFDRINKSREIYPSREGQNWQLLLPMFYYYKSGYIDKPMFYFVYRNDSVSNITSQKGLPDKLGQIEEYQRIIYNTLDTMQLDDSERKRYMDIVERKYARLKLRLALKFKDGELLDRQYFLLQENGWDTFFDKLLYLSDKSFYLGWMCRAARFLKKVFEKGLRLVRL